VRIPAAWVAGLCFVSSSAFANPTAPELQQQGEDLAKQGRFTEAIDSFKAADKLQPSAAHACLIALAYTRRELWPQAEIWLQLCQVRASPQDPLPDWAPAEQDQIGERLTAANVAAVQIEVQPAEAGAKLTVSSFAPDEQFAPRTIHLPFGTHQIFAHAQGYKDESQTLEVTDKTAKHVVIVMHKPESGVVGAPLPVAHGDSGKKLMVAGGVVIGAGFVAYGVMGIGWAKLNNKEGFGGGYETMYDVGRVSSIGLWVIGAGLVAIGYVKHSHAEESPAIAVTPLPGGGMFSVGWSR
jgi:hypothetical protein